jgi:hypothetical protein
MATCFSKISMSKNKYPFQLYEGKKPTDKHIRLTANMMNSKAYLDLSPYAKVLYNYMKLWSRGNIEFEYSAKLSKKYIGSNTTYIRAKNELIKKGFIECIRTCKCSRMPNRYKFIFKWIDE